MRWGNAKPSGQLREVTRAKLCASLYPVHPLRTSTGEINTAGIIVNDRVTSHIHQIAYRHKYVQDKPFPSPNSVILTICLGFYDRCLLDTLIFR